MILSLDISTSCIGYAVIDSKEGKLIELGCIKMNNKHTLFQKFSWFVKNTEEIFKLPISYIAIEEPLKKFKGKFSSADVIAKLNFFNGMISSYCYSKTEKEPFYYNVNIARSTVWPDEKFSREEGDKTKHQVWDRVKSIEPQINWRYSTRTRALLDENYDMCDAYVVGVAHFLILSKQKS